MRTLRLVSPWDHAFCGSLHMLVGAFWGSVTMLLAAGDLVRHSDASEGWTIGDAVVLPIAFCAACLLYIGFQLLARSPYELQVSPGGVIHFVSVLGRRSIPSSAVEAVRAGATIHQEGVPAVTVVHQAGTIAITKCPEWRDLLQFLSELNSNIRFEGLDSDPWPAA